MCNIIIIIIIIIIIAYHHHHTMHHVVLLSVGFLSQCSVCVLTLVYPLAIFHSTLLFHIIFLMVVLGVLLIVYYDTQYKQQTTHSSYMIVVTRSSNNIYIQQGNEKIRTIIYIWCFPVSPRIISHIINKIMGIFLNIII